MIIIPMGEPEWLTIKVVNSDMVGDSVYVDTVTHCANWRQMADSSKTTTAHECTHGINNQIRNAAGNRKNGFYVLKDRGIVLTEPNIRKRDVIPYIPQALRGDRYSTYVAGQSDWDKQPLYLFDEWVAYRNGAECGIDMTARGESPPKTDLVRGPLEFNVYCLALMMAVAEKDPANFDQLLPFFRWHYTATWTVYYAGKDLFPFSGQEKYEETFFGPSGDQLRQFYQKHQRAF